jgi:hypothetical protein
MPSTFSKSSNVFQNPKFEILLDTVDIVLNDNNLKPGWVEHPALYTEFHIKRNRKNLLIVVGESWVYGETIKTIRSGVQQYSFETQLEFCMGVRLATILGTDLYQYAVPGNCNFYMFSELERIINATSKMGYDKIYICMQMTEPSREESLIVKLREQNHPLAELIHPTRSMTFDSWLQEYDDVFFDQYDNLISRYNNLECILWKNFCKINSKNRDRKFKIIDPTWIQYSASILGKTLQAPSFYAIGWLDTVINDIHYSTIKFNKSDLTKEIDIIEKSNNFIKANSLHSHHPNEFAHLLWAQYLARKSGWNNDL